MNSETSAYPNGSVLTSGISALISESIVATVSFLCLFFIQKGSARVEGPFSEIQCCVALSSRGGR